MNDAQTDQNNLSDAEIARRFEATVRRMAKTPPEPKPDKRTRPLRPAEDKVVAALQARITAYFRGLTGLPSRKDYIQAVLGSFPDGLIQPDFGVIAPGTTNPCVLVRIDPLFDILTAHAAKQWHDHVASPNVSEAPRASS